MKRSELFWLDVLTILWLLLICAALSGCASGPKRTRPEGMPYPVKVRPGLRVIPLEQARCLGGAIGGCVWRP